MSTVAAPLETPLPQSPTVVSRRALLGLSVMLLAHLPILWRYVVDVVELPHYEFVMLLPIGVAVIAWPRCRTLGNLSPGRALPFYGWIGAALIMLAASIVFDSPWFGAISSLPAAAGTAYAVGGRRLLMAILPAWALLWIGIRLPLSYDEKLAQSLQKIAAQRASHVMNYFGVEHILDGNVVETPPDVRYMVEEACSGVQSLFAITACTLFFALWMREPVGRVILLLIVGWWWVWVANVVRVIAVTVLNSRWGLPVDEGWGHDALTIVLFVATLGLIVSSEHLFLFLLPRGIFSRNERIDAGVVRPFPNHGPTHMPPLGQTQLASPMFIGAYLAVGLLQWLPQMYVPSPSATPVLLGKVDASLAPPTIAGWHLRPEVVDAEGVKHGPYETEQRRADSQWGAHSHTWHYVKGPRELIISLDYPFRGWHELTICYDADGWQVESRNVIDVKRAAAGGEQREKCVESVLHRPELSNYAYLLFTNFNDRQQPLPAERMNVFQKFKDRLASFLERVQTLGASGSGQNDQVQSFQLQVLLQGATTPTEEDRRDATAAFVEFRSRLEQFLRHDAGQGGGP